MTIHFSNCHGVWEIIAFFGIIISIFLIIYSSTVLFSSEKKLSWKENKKEVIIHELLGFLHPIVTSRFLKPEVIKYRWLLIGSISMIAILIILFNSLNLCAPIT